MCSMHACAPCWHVQRMSLASPAESGMTIILERSCISPTEAICQRDRPYMKQATPARFGYSNRHRRIRYILAFEQYLCIFNVAFVCIDVESIYKISQVHSQPPVQMTNMARKTTNDPHH